VSTKLAPAVIIVIIIAVRIVAYNIIKNELSYVLYLFSFAGATPLHAAVRTGHLEIAQYLVERAGMNIYAAFGISIIIESNYDLFI
jgi:hypothetical protein